MQKESEEKRSPNSSKRVSQVNEKYLNQLTLAMIESETLLDVKKARSRRPQETLLEDGLSPGGLQGGLSPQACQVGGDAVDDSELLEVDSVAEPAAGGDPAKTRTVDASLSHPWESTKSSSKDWRQYFTMEEITTAFAKIQRGQDPTEDEVESGDAGSDSCPSEDNLDLKQLYDIMYC